MFFYNLGGRARLPAGRQAFRCKPACSLQCVSGCGVPAEKRDLPAYPSGRLAPQTLRKALRRAFRYYRWRIIPIEFMVKKYQPQGHTKSFRQKTLGFCL